MLNDNTIPIIGRKREPCTLCGKLDHKIHGHCSYDDLKARVKMLLMANSAIPGVLSTNKEVTTLANTFQTMVQDISRAMVLCEKVVMEFENGPNIWARFIERLEKERCQISSPATAEIPAASSPENTIQSETENNPCTVETPDGETTAGNSSPSTDSATPVENAPQ